MFACVYFYRVSILTKRNTEREDKGLQHMNQVIFDLTLSWRWFNGGEQSLAGVSCGSVGVHGVVLRSLEVSVLRGTISAGSPVTSIHFPFCLMVWRSESLRFSWLVDLSVGLSIHCLFSFFHFRKSISRMVYYSVICISKA